MTNISLPYDVSENPVAIYNRIAHTHITIIDNSNRDIKCLEIVNCTFSDLVLNIGIIDKLIITNYIKYYHAEYEQLFDKVKNNGTIIINNIIVGKLDCNKFSNVQINSCIILNLIDSSNIAIIDEDNIKYKMNYSSVICNSYINRFKIIEYDDGIYCGEVSYDSDKKMIRHGYGRMTYTQKYRIMDVYEGRWLNDKRRRGLNECSITYTLDKYNKGNIGPEGTKMVCIMNETHNIYKCFRNVRIYSSNGYSNTATVLTYGNIDEVMKSLFSSNFK